jgi:MoxR-like ATPase
MKDFDFKREQIESWEGGMADDDPDNYILNPELNGAVKTALALGQPLLLTGEPGTGKTQLAHKVADYLHRVMEGQFLPKAEVFHTKTTSTARDLFYSYDALSHFHDPGKRPAKHFVHLRALGRAILQSLDDDDLRQPFHEIPDLESGKSSVVLIDEIDKAPRDFPNDLLHEMENFAFHIPELQREEMYRKGKGRIVVILTSNSEKNLPEAFLRRCVFHHIKPHERETLRLILEKRFGKRLKGTEKILLDHYEDFRKAITGKRPATAEFIRWVRILELENLLDVLKPGTPFEKLPPEIKQKLVSSLSVLVKTKADMENAIKVLER